MGRFFGELTDSLAVLLFSAPLLGWLTELPPRFRGLARIAMVAAPVALAVVLAKDRFDAESAQPSPRPKQPPVAAFEPELQDYENYRKN